MAKTWKRETDLAKAVWRAGFTYDEEQDIIKSRRGAWQRKFGYAYSYDVSAPVTISAVIDCEPFFFVHNKKHWMIELWKGQYGLESGGEIGVYVDYHKDVLDTLIGARPHDPKNGRLFNCASDAEQLEMSFTLYRNGKELFHRGPERHWWVTGFKWGVLSKPEELVMDLRIRFPSTKMRDAFVAAVEKTGYTDVNVDGTAVGFTFAKPKNFQPRDDPKFKAMVDLAQRNNRNIVGEYKRLALPVNDPNKIDDNAASALINYFDSYKWNYWKRDIANLHHLSPSAILRDLKRIWS